MSYIVICEEAKDASGVRQAAVVTGERGTIVRFKTKEDAARESSRLNREAQKQPTAAIRHYWVQQE